MMIMANSGASCLGCWSFELLLHRLLYSDRHPNFFGHKFQGGDGGGGGGNFTTS